MKNNDRLVSVQVSKRDRMHYNNCVLLYLLFCSFKPTEVKKRKSERKNYPISSSGSFILTEQVEYDTLRCACVRVCVAQV